MSKKRRRRLKFVCWNAFEAIKNIRNGKLLPAARFCKRHDIEMEPISNYREGWFFFGWHKNSPTSKKLDLIERISEFASNRIDSETKTSPESVPAPKGVGGS